MGFYAAEDLQIFLSDAFENLKRVIEIVQNAYVRNRRCVEDFLELANLVYRYRLKKFDESNIKKFLQLSQPRSLADVIERMREYPDPIKNVDTAAIKIANSIEILTSADSVSDLIESIGLYLEGLKKDYGKSIEDIFYTDPPFFYLSEFAKSYDDDMDSFLDDLDKAIATLANVPTDDDENVGKEYFESKIHLMTALRAKGKEFDAVIILDANDGIWPNRLALENEGEEQERRLFYVAMTRAIKRLIIIYNESIVDEKVKVSKYVDEAFK
jgi:DNA helicase-2/ATP-dependent DNA helicase PcrA